MKHSEELRGCSTRFPRYLSSFLDGELSPRRKRRVRQHLDECAFCRKELRQLEAVHALLQQVQPVSPTRDFTLSESQAQSRRPILWYPRLRAATMVVATLVLLLSLGGLLQPGLSGPLPPTPRSVALKPTPRFSPSPAPAIVAPAMTRRAAPTSVVVAPAPTEEDMGILSPSEPGQTAYPEPEVTPWIGATVSPRKATPTEAQAETSSQAPLWPILEVVGLSLLGLLLGLTWISYRRERRFFS